MRQPPDIVILLPFPPNSVTNSQVTIPEKHRIPLCVTITGGSSKRIHFPGRSALVGEECTNPCSNYDLYTQKNYIHEEVHFFPENGFFWNSLQFSHLRQRIRVQLRPLRDVTPGKEHLRDLRVRPRHLAQLVLRLVAHHLDYLPLLVLRVR